MALNYKIKETADAENESIEPVEKVEILDKKLSSEIPPENVQEIVQEKKTRKTRESKTKPQKATKNEVNALANQIEAAHKIVAIVTNLRELELTSNESELLANSITEVLSHHAVNIDPKIAAYLNLLGVAAMVYGPRGYAIYQRKKESLSQVTAPQNKFETDQSPIVEQETVDNKVQPVPSAALDIANELNYDSELEAW